MRTEILSTLGGISEENCFVKMHSELSPDGRSYVLEYCEADTKPE
jgi:hypothetical protein